MASYIYSITADHPVTNFGFTIRTYDQTVHNSTLILCLKGKKYMTAMNMEEEEEEQAPIFTMGEWSSYEKVVPDISGDFNLR